MWGVDSCIFRLLLYQKNCLTHIPIRFKSCTPHHFTEDSLYCSLGQYKLYVVYLNLYKTRNGSRWNDRRPVSYNDCYPPSCYTFAFDGLSTVAAHTAPPVLSCRADFRGWCDCSVYPISHRDTRSTVFTVFVVQRRLSWRKS